MLSFQPPQNCRLDHWLICQLVEPGSRVLDLGCGTGDLLELLTHEKGIHASGVEVSEAKVYECVSKGLSVHHGDIDEGLSDYPDASFDYVILSQTLQEILHPGLVIKEMLRVGKKGIVGFPNFAHWRNRWQLLFHGTTPTRQDPPSRWDETSSIQFMSIRDFERLCKDDRVRIVQTTFLSRDRRIHFLANLLAETAIFVLSSHA